MKKVMLIFWSFLLVSHLTAQENRKEDGVKVGAWAHKDARGLVYAEGNYEDGIKVGKWRYYVSPVSRYTHVADVSGNYDELGQKTGNWLFISMQTKMQVEAEFENNLLHGRCSYFDADGEIMATGIMDAGIRNNLWVFYQNGEEMTRGYYQNGIRMGDWVYDYYPEENLHVKGVLNYDNGSKSGKLFHYKVDHHPKFGTNELLSGIGQYIRGKKVGRWIEYTRNMNMELVEAGMYNQQGKRHGVWRTTINRKNHKIALYENGILEGAYKEFHDNGQLKYEATYQNNAPIGAFTRYYNNGNTEETGTTVFIPNTGNLKKDTVYMDLQLPYEYHFKLVDEPNFHQLKYNYVQWITTPNYSIEPAELDRRFASYLDYGLEPQKRIRNIVVDDKQAVRKGAYKAFFKNGKIKLEGEYHPSISEFYDVEQKTTIRDFTRTGKWLQYDDNGYVMRTMLYDKGELVELLDDKGQKIDPLNEEKSTDESADSAPQEENGTLEIIEEK